MVIASDRVRESLHVVRFIWRKHPIAALSTYVGMLLPLVAPLTVLVFLGSFIPLVGAIIAGSLATLVAFASLLMPDNSEAVDALHAGAREHRDFGAGLDRQPAVRAPAMIVMRVKSRFSSAVRWAARAFSSAAEAGSSWATSGRISTKRSTSSRAERIMAGT